ncbi:hypothetical protein BYT27DRAFT_7194771 [Phlegmacium glaucopus]|nr:hypothetical protein BYT27DRAFT_7194771 [Phlegmacium glaucopus]
MDPDHASLPPIVIQATTTRTVDSELIPRSTSDITNPSSVSSTTPLHPIPTASLSAVEKDEIEPPSNRFSSRPLPVLPHEFVPQDIRVSQPMVTDQARSITLERRGSLGPRSALDWIVPLDDGPKSMRERTVGERLDPTLLTAIAEKNKHASKAKLTGFMLNAAIGLQVVLGSLTTGLSVVTTGRQTSIMTAILGGLATVVASYLARMRGSNEPELSNTRVKDLDQFVRECEAFKMDHGHMLGKDYNRELENFRHRFEDLLGNVNGERRSTLPV